MIPAIDLRDIAMLQEAKRYVVVPILATGRTQYAVVDRHTQETVCSVFSKVVATYQAKQLNNDYDTKALWAKLHARV